MDDRDVLRTFLRQFIDGTDRSVAQANRIEALVETQFFEDERLERLARAAAKYQPGGGEQLLDAEAMANVCRAALAVLGEDESSE